MVHIEGEEALKTLEKLFDDYQLDEYKKYLDAVKTDFYRMGAELRAMKEGMKHGKGEAA